MPDQLQPSTPPRFPAPILELAPVPKSSNRIIYVLGGGILSTILTLLLVYFLDRKADVNVMGWYANGILPAGAIIVGLAASGGYALASWYAGYRVRSRLLLAIVALQILAYFTTHWLQFFAQGPLVTKTGHVLSFWEYYHVTTVSMAWKDRVTGQPGEPLGNLGYLIRVGDIVGFVIGAVAPSALLLKAAYCDLCERYMSDRTLAVLAASPAKVGFLSRKKSDAPSPQEALETGTMELVSLMEHAATADAAAFVQEIRPFQDASKANKKLPSHISLAVRYCKQCYQGELRAILEEGKGRQGKTSVLGTTPASPEFVHDLVNAPELRRIK